LFGFGFDAATRAILAQIAGLRAEMSNMATADMIRDGLAFPLLGSIASGTFDSLIKSVIIKTKNHIRV